MLYQSVGEGLGVSVSRERSSSCVKENKFMAGRMDRGFDFGLLGDVGWFNTRVV